MVHLRSENVPNDVTSFCAIFCRFLLFYAILRKHRQSPTSQLSENQTNSAKTLRKHRLRVMGFYRIS